MPAAYSERQLPRCNPLGSRNASEEPCDRCSCTSAVLTEAVLPSILTRAGQWPAWDAYLLSVYGEAPSYPVHLASYHWFYRCGCAVQFIDCASQADACSGCARHCSTPHAPTGPALLPISWQRFGASFYFAPNRYAPPCEDGRREAYAGVRCASTRSGVPRNSACPNWRLSAFGFWQWPAAAAARAQLADDHSWVEVLRHQEFLEEPGPGHHNATWWFVARGSGTWLSVGRTCVESRGCGPPPTFQPSKRRHRWANWGRANGFDTIQFVSHPGLHAHEIVDLRMQATSVCAPARLLRSGPAANRPCVCDANARITRCVGASPGSAGAFTLG
tara:strand:- start:225 stop:1217 length:993 start_codon:yes stop_codon:yes gene_type:complete